MTPPPPLLSAPCPSSAGCMTTCDYIFLQSCLLAVGKNQVWAGSLDTTIYVINTQTGKGGTRQSCCCCFRFYQRQFILLMQMLGLGQTPNLSQIEFVKPINFEIRT